MRPARTILIMQLSNSRKEKQLWPSGRGGSSADGGGGDGDPSHYGTGEDSPDHGETGDRRGRILGLEGERSSVIK